mgnify:CR=1 FL=1|jgi:hypothetical protein
MLSIKKKSSGEYTEVSGSSAEVMMFYCFWQSHQWPAWAEHSKIGSEGDPATMEWKAVIDSIKDGRPLLMMFEKSCDFAAEKMRALGVRVVSVSPVNQKV